MGDAEAAHGGPTPGGVNAFLAPLLALQVCSPGSRTGGSSLAGLPPACSAPRGLPPTWMPFS